MVFFVMIEWVMGCVVGLICFGVIDVIYCCVEIGWIWIVL